MVLSRFWLIIFISSILFIVASLFSSNQYSIDYVLNGKKDDPILIGETYLKKLPHSLQDTLKKVPETLISVNLNDKYPDTSYIYKNKIVQIFSGVQKSDGLLPTCKNTLLDLMIPLIAYLAFFCGLMQLLIDSGAAERLAKRLSPLFVKVFPTVPKNHESISYMTLNFAANFLGLDSAAFWSQSHAKFTRNKS
jgi:Ni,Fe-hydrogenase III small subunit